MNKLTADTLESLFSLEGRTGIVTGASGGIGKGIAMLLSNAGAKVYNLDITVPEKEYHKCIVSYKVDITNMALLKKTIDEIGSKDGIDFLVNNAGITKLVRAEDVTPEWWAKIHSVNIDALYFASQFAYPYLKKSESAGRIVNITSMAAYMGFSRVVPYCATKSGVSGITRGLATEWAEDNILVNSVSPGWFQSDMNKQVVDKDRERKILAKIALGKYGRMDDIAQMVFFLLSNASTYITGQDFSVDGGARSFGY
ncbi:MAG: SDR family NAD(P)-dependent oxidoreductase [Spirochaetales bacterium]|uniref:SDR family NAD(P)-dependent oxidoreductase n=1 Tax=Candidatus Thalassospirochaeta sargassi TaxID=3119039 RepID=A0AAJ1IES2_9SPIO|nr:SDR family NAD(P)-dependent oxidoreductase [Spirochaetales bacterium]